MIPIRKIIDKGIKFLINNVKNVICQFISFTSMRDTTLHVVTVINQKIMQELR